MEREFYIPETRNDPVLRGRIGLEQYQKDALREAFSTDAKGNFKYSIIVWSDIKKSGKSTIAAAVNLFRAEYTEWGEFYVVANDLKQADSRVAHYIRRAIQLSPRMRDSYRTMGYRTIAPNGSFIEAIPIDPSGEAGSNADQISFSELWGANENQKQTMWAEMTIPPQKHGKAFRWIESYAGFSGESKLLYSLYDMGVKQGRKLWPDKLYDVTESEP
jgi:phage terminase large subunit-like protein